MQAQERQLIIELFDRLSAAENQVRDREVQELLGQELRRAPNAVYTMAQTVLAQNHALELAGKRIAELEQRAAAQAAPQYEERYTDDRQPGAMGAPGPWQRGGQPSYGQNYDPPPYGDRQYGAPPQQQRMGMGGGGGFLAGAGQVAMGVAGGMLAAEAAKSLLGAGGEATSSAASSLSSAAGLGGEQGSNALGQEAGLGDVGGQNTADAGNAGGGGGFFDWLTGRGGSENNQNADQNEKDVASHDDGHDDHDPDDHDHDEGWDDDGGDESGWA